MYRAIRIAAVCLVVALLAGCGAKAASRINLPPILRKPTVEEQLAKTAGPVEQRMEVRGGWVVLSPATNGERALSYLIADGEGFKRQGKPVTVPDDAKVRKDGELLVVEWLKGGAPQISAYEPVANETGLAPVNYHRLRAPEPSVKTGHFVLINKYLNQLYYYVDGQLVEVFPVATGRQTDPPAPTWSDYKTNFFTPEGSFVLTQFAVNPPYNALKPGDQSYAGGAPGNPLGTRWMGFEVLNGDNAWLWGIHGTSEPEKIGTWASDGCIRMFTKDAEALFAAIKGKNARLQIVAK